METETGTAFIEALREYFQMLAASLPGVLALVVIVAVAVAIGWLVRLASAWLLKVLGFDKFSYRTGLTALLEKGNVKKSPSDMIGVILYWVIILASLLAGLQALRIEAIDKLASGFLIYVPRLVVAIVIFILGYLVMVFLGRTVLIAAVNARLRFARWLGTAVQILVMLFTLAMAADELGIAQNIIIVTFSITFGGLVLALSLAFGLGAKDVARDWIEKWIGTGSKEEGKRDEFSHM